MQIKDLMRTDVPVCVEDMPLSEVYALLRDSGHDHVVVLDSSAHRKPIGIVNEHSICEHVIGRRRDPRGLTAGNVLSTSHLCVGEDTEIATLAISTDIVPDAIISVNRRREFTGTVDRARLNSAMFWHRLPASGLSHVAGAQNDTVRLLTVAAAAKH